ncbi:MAG: YicC family protein [Synergistaceae bacterium]|nr:YicC family protein [Synergistaceae bacterium]
MFLSMTGFGRAARVFPWGTVTFEITSVNHRYQEISVRLPREIASLESRVSLLLRGALKRGKVRLGVDIEWSDARGTAKVDEEALASYYTQVRGLAERLFAPPPRLTDFLSLPGVCDAQRACEEADWDALTLEAAGALLEMKRSEGAKLEEAVRLELAEFERLTGALSARWNVAAPEALESLRTRTEKVMERFGLDVDPNRAAQEVSLLADKWDVSEELARLSAHIGKFREIAGGGSEGRKLDFLVQEMNREVNTMGSKVGDAEFRWGVVEAKSSLERIREQIQNIE